MSAEEQQDEIAAVILGEIEDEERWSKLVASGVAIQVRADAGANLLDPDFPKLQGACGEAWRGLLPVRV